MKFFISLIQMMLILIAVFPAIAQNERNWVEAKNATRQVTISGFTRAHSTMPVTSEVSGKVKQIFADEGGNIPADQIFACLDDILVEIDIKSAQNEIEQHQVDINFFQKEVSRHQKLVEKRTAAVSTLDRIKKDLYSSIRSRQAASLKKMRLEELKSRHCIKAPQGWLVVERNIEPGQWVNEGEVLAQVGDYTKLSVPLALSLDEYKQIKLNPDKIKFLIQDFDVTVDAQIDHISPAFDEDTHKILVEFTIDNGIPEFRGGLRAELKLDIPMANHSFTISKLALEERYEEYWLHRKDGKKIRVELLNNHSNGTVTISSPDIRAGDQFKMAGH